jgi:hypothetical protein
VNRTVRLRVEHPAAQPGIVGQVVLALATAAGVGALAADRVRGAAEADAMRSQGWLGLESRDGAGGLEIRLASADPTWVEGGLELVDRHDGAVGADGSVTVTLRRPGLRAVDPAGDV